MTESSDLETRRVASLRELPRSLEPPRDLWPAIEARLAEAPSVVRATAPVRAGATRLRWLAAAAMVASVAVGVWIGRDLLPGGARTPLAQTALNASKTPAMKTPALKTPAVTPGAATTLDAAYVSDERYQRQRAALLASLQAQLASMPPETRAKVTASLATIEQAKQDLEQALGKDPGNALLQELLVDTYQDEMRVLTDVHDASDPGRGI
jgi:hypothetical protein